MAKITTEDCKQAIVDYIYKNPEELRKQFVDMTDPLLQMALASACDKKNWKRMFKGSPTPGVIERGFNCVPFDDQLRAYVYENNHQITKIDVQGE